MKEERREAIISTRVSGVRQSALRIEDAKESCVLRWAWSIRRIDKIEMRLSENVGVAVLVESDTLGESINW